MEKYSRSKSSREAHQQQNQQMKPTNMYDLRTHSTPSEYNNIPSSCQSNMELQNYYSNNQHNMKKKKRNDSYSWGGGFNMDNPELQRKKRIAGYKAYGAEGRMKSSFRKSFRWIKDTCSHVVHGFW